MAALDYNGATASGTATQFITQVTQADGLVSATKASIPSAGTNLGMVKSGGDVTISSGVITVKDDSHNHIISNIDGLQSALDAKATPANITSAIAALDYTSPETDGTALEFITTVSQTDGVISATKAAIPVASSDTLGLVKSGTDITVDASGNVSVKNNSHNHTIDNITNLQSTLDAKATPAQITNAIAALDYTGATANGKATSFITQVTQTDGVVSATKASIPIATSSQAGLVKSGTDITVDSSGNVSVVNNSHSHTSANISDLSTTINTVVTNAIGALDASDPAASGTATQFITSISQKDGVITATKANITAAALGLSGAMKFLGTSKTAITDGATTNPIMIGSTSTTVTSGNVVLYGSKEFVWTGSAWEELGNEGSYKVQQSAVSSPSTSGNATAFIDTISQNAQGVITATKKNVTFPTLSGGSAVAADATIVGGVTVNGHAVTVGKKTLTAGDNVTITGASDKITIAAKDTKYSTMGAATASAAGASGLVPAPAAGKQGQYLRGDGTWATPTDTTYNEATTSAAGLMSTVDKTKLDNVDTYATSIPFVVGTQTATTGTWTGMTSEISSLVDGQTIRYWLPYKGNGNATLNLTLADGTTTGAINCYYNGATRLATHYAAGNIILLTYRENVSIAGSSTKYTGWWAQSDYGDGNYYDRIRYQQNIKCGTTAIVAANIIVGNNGEYQHLKSGSAFDITYPILYADAAIAASSTGISNYLVRSFTITTTQSITLTAYKPVFIKGSLSGTIFTPISTTPLTQTVPTSADGYEYILLGTAYSSTAMYLLSEHPIFAYKGGAFGQISGKDITDLSVSGKTITYTRGDGTTGTITTQDTTYSAATTSANGLMTSTMVTKLNGIANGATADTAITTDEINSICV